MKLAKATRGFTLIEMLLALGVVALVASAFTAITFEVVKGNTKVNNRLLVVNDIQIAAKWLYLDGEKAESTDLIDQAAPVDTMSLLWTLNETPHQSDYYLSGSALLRDHNGNVVTIARNVSDVDFSLDDRLITVNLSSSSGGGDVTKQATYLIYLRPTD